MLSFEVLIASSLFFFLGKGFLDRNGIAADLNLDMQRRGRRRRRRRRGRVGNTVFLSNRLIKVGRILPVRLVVYPLHLFECSRNVFVGCGMKQSPTTLGGPSGLPAKVDKGGKIPSHFICLDMTEVYLIGIGTSPYIVYKRSSLRNDNCSFDVRYIFLHFHTYSCRRLMGHTSRLLPLPIIRYTHV